MEIDSAALAAFEKKIHYQFEDRSLLQQALTHPSVLQEAPANTPNNQRLEFLGDAVVQLVLTAELFGRFTDEREGQLSKRRATLARGQFLADLALELGLDELLIVSPAERQADGHRRPAALEDALEALVGAIFLDRGWDSARETVLRWYGDITTRLDRLQKRENPKGRLQELVQPVHGNEAIRYEVIRELGEPHNRTFEVRVLLRDREIGTGAGSSKKEAEENAARVALKSWPPR